MNKNFMQLLLFSGLSLISISVFGACEAELNKMIQACTYCTASQIEGFKRGHQMLQGDPWSEGKIADLEHFMKESQQNVNRTGGTYALHIVNLYSAEHQMCFVRRQEGKDKVNPSSNSSTVEVTSPQSNSDTPPIKKLTAAEQKRQQAQQKADDLGTQSQQLAQENQSKADAARQGKRKRHNQDYQASQCVKVDYNFGIFGALINTCNFKIHYTYCGYHPTESSWLSHMACENQKFGSGAISPLKRTTAHTKQVEGIYWLACKDPAWPLDQVFVEGQGVKGRCREPGTNY